MESKPTEEANSRTDQSASEPNQESPRFTLYDLRPEKDPMGAGRNRRPKAGA